MTDGYQAEYYETSKQFIDLSGIAFTGRILDVGGGGKGIISQHSGDRVVAIDKRADELAETPDIGTKIVMDACQLCFLDEYFDNITCFYVLMYMDLRQIEQFLHEAHRVLKDGGTLWIWDAVIPANPKSDVFVAQLSVKVSGELTISTGYGVSWDKELSLKMIEEFCEREGFSLLASQGSTEAFSLCLCKGLTDSIA